MSDDKIKARPNALEVNGSTFIGSQFAQVVGVSVTDTEVILEFVFVHPQSKGKGQTVSRITMPLSAAVGLSKVIIETLQKHESNKKRN